MKRGVGSVLSILLFLICLSNISSQDSKFVPDNFIVPDTLETDKFRMRMLSVDDAEKDYEAIMSSLEHLRERFYPYWGWPYKELTLKEDRNDLIKHQKEFIERSAFAYTVMNKDESKCLGCVYVNPTSKKGYDAVVHLWVTKEAYDEGLDANLYKEVREWINTKWSFENVAYPGRDITWEDWGKTPSNNTSATSNLNQLYCFEDDKRVEKIKGIELEAHKIFKNHFESIKSPSLAYGVIVDDSLILSSSFGKSNIKRDISATTKSSYRIASMTKSIIAMAIMKLRDEGKISLELPIEKYLPELANIKYPNKDNSKITIRNLLTMTSGFPEDNYWADRQLDQTNDMLDLLLKKGVSFSSYPNSNFEYSNLSYALLGKIISNTSGTSYQNYITTNILQPLDMNETYWKYQNVTEYRLCLGYNMYDNGYKIEPMLNDGVFAAIGGLISSIEDFGKYVSYLLYAWPARDDVERDPLKRSTLREMQTAQFSSLNTRCKDFDGNVCPKIVGYGYGLGISEDCKGIKRVEHSGSLPGFGSKYIFYPDYGIGIIAFSNLSYSSPIPLEIEKLIFKKANIKPRILRTPEILIERQEQVIDLIKNWNTTLEREILADNLYLDEPRELRIDHINEIFKKAGKIVKIGRVTPWSRLRGSFNIYTKNGIIDVYFALNPEVEPKIQDLYITYNEKK